MLTSLASDVRLLRFLVESDFTEEEQEGKDEPQKKEGTMRKRLVCRFSLLRQPQLLAAQVSFGLARTCVQLLMAPQSLKVARAVLRLANALLLDGYEPAQTAFLDYFTSVSGSRVRFSSFSVLNVLS